VTAIQRFGSALNTNVHFHTLVAQGVFFEKADGTLGFAPARSPTDVEVVRLFATVRRRIVRFVKRHGIDLERPSNEVEPADERLFDCPVYAEIQGASVAGRVATGPRAGRPVMRIGRDLYTAEITSTGPLHAHLEGFDLHAAVGVPAGDRERLEHLCRYVLRPPIAQEALELTPEGKVLLRLRRPWTDGTRAILFEPTELLEKLAAMVPKPRINLLVYHGVFAPNARCRRSAVGWARADGACQAGVPQAAHGEIVDTAATTVAPGNGGERADWRPQGSRDSPATGAGTSAKPGAASSTGYTRPKYRSWADLLSRTFQIDALVCPGCGGRLRLISTIDHRRIIDKILRHLGLPTETPEPSPARHPAWLPGFEPPSDLGSEWAN
jgi:hypothetical protein